MTTIAERTTTATPPARFRDLLAAEWLKLWSTTSVRWALGLATLFAVVVSVNASLADHRNWPSYSADRRALFNPLRDAFPEAGYVLLVLAAGSVGAMVIVGEYSSGLIRTTFAAVPARRSVMAAKALVVGAVMTVVGAVAAGASFGVSQAILADRNAGYSLADPGVLRAVAATALFVPVCALLGMGIGGVVRHPAGAVVAITAVLLLLPRLVDTQQYRWVAEVHNALPFPAWERLIQLRPDVYHPEAFPATVAGSWMVFALWPLGAVLAAVVVVHRRDL